MKPTPVVAGDVIYFVTFSAESDPGEQEIVPSFQEALAKLDANKDGKLSKDEIVDPRAKNRFDEYLDLDDTGFLEERDWKQFQERRLGESSVRAYRLGGEGDLTERNYLWKNPRSLPNVPSPLFYRGVLYTLKEGGILTSFDTKTGEIVKQARLPGALGDYFLAGRRRRQHLRGQRRRQSRRDSSRSAVGTASRQRSEGWMQSHAGHRRRQDVRAHVRRAVLFREEGLNSGFDVVLGKIPLRHAPLFGGEIDQVRASGGVMPGRGVFPIRLARTNGLEEMAEVRNGRVRAVAVELLRFGLWGVRGSTSVAITLGSL